MEDFPEYKKLLEHKGREIWSDLYEDGFWDAGFYDADYMDANRMRQAAQELIDLADRIDRGEFAGLLPKEASA